MTMTTRAKYTKPVRVRSIPKVTLSHENAPRVSTRKRRSRNESGLYGEDFPTVGSQIIYNKTFSLHRFTPLFNFEISRTAFDTYGEQLKTFLMTQLEDEIPNLNEIEDNGNGTEKGGKIISVEFSKIDFEGWQSSNEIKPFSIRIGYKPKGVLKEQELCVILFPAREEVATDEHFLNFPLAMIKSPVALTVFITSWFEKKFDCRSSVLRLQPIQLVDMVELWIKWVAKGKGTERTNDERNKSIAKPLELTYALPNIAEINTLTLNMSFEDVKRIYKVVQETSILDDNRSLTINAIRNHMYNYSRIDIAYLALVRVGTSLSYVAAEGKLKIFAVEDWRYTLRLLIQLVEIADARVTT